MTMFILSFIKVYSSFRNVWRDFVGKEDGWPERDELHNPPPPLPPQVFSTFLPLLFHGVPHEAPRRLSQLPYRLPATICSL